MFKRLILLTVILMTALLDLIAGEGAAPRFSGYMFGDFYSVMANHDSALVGRNGFWFRRIYFTYEQDINEDFSVRLRLEMSSPGDFDTKATAIVPYIKDAYLKYKFAKHQELYLGISEAPAFKLLDKVWGYRFLEKTPLDLYKWAPSRDFGLAAKGYLNESGSLKYHFFLGNGNGYKSEINKGKKLALAIGAFPTENLIVEFYGDWIDNTGVQDWFTYQLIAAYKNKKMTLGIQGTIQTRKASGQPDNQMELLSAFYTQKISEAWGTVLRVDRNFDPNPDGAKIRYLPMDPNQKSLLIIAGVDFIPADGIHFTPNIEFVKYDDKTPGSNDDKDIMGRITFFYNFK